MEEDTMDDFCDTYNVNNLIKEPTCFKSEQHLTSIDMIVTNKSASFQNSVCSETDISDHYCLKGAPKEIKHHKIKYRDYKNF